MSREIKFSGFENGKKIYGTSGEIPDETGKQFRYGLVTFFDLVQNGHIKNVCGFTGLLDKNDDEIYEDDVVDIDNGHEWYRYRIVFLDGSFKIARLRERIKILMLLEIPCRNKDIKVIGNIYENPELLKETK